jgi:cytidine deaminase
VTDEAPGYEATLTPVEERALVEVARRAIANAYAPYSGYRVGAAVLGPDGQTFPGCNVECASYGLTICAERSAIAALVAAGCRHVRAIAVASEGSPLPWPCGACRQVLAEFCDDAWVVVVAGSERGRARLRALLPHAFSLGEHDASPPEGALP